MSEPAPPADEPTPSAWVMQADSPRDLARAVAAARAIGVSREVAFDRATVCLELDDAPSTKLAAKIERRLGGPVEARLDCDVAWAPLGSGFLLLTVDPPATELEAALDAAGPTFRDVIHPSDPDEVIRVCLPRLAVPDAVAFADHLREAGLGVRAVYEVGGCRR
ncbi:MAG: hypothetical protein ABMB14_10470 [Myxococcota bacterium]